MEYGTHEITSPITGSNNVELVTCISVQDLIKKYSKFDIDVSNYFKGIEKVSIYKCIDTDLDFYHPAITGDGTFYRNFQSFQWYYQDDKWEYDIVTNDHIQRKDVVLEIGSGKGAFLKKMKDKGITAIGLELNQEAVKEAKSIGLDMHCKDIVEYGDLHPQKFDVVCSFQVMEHVSNPKEIIEASLKLLKIGGKLIISVPNNSSFIGKTQSATNYPPHHVLLWGIETFKALPKFFNIQYVTHMIEPLQKDHIGEYISVKFQFLVNSLGIVGKIIKRILFLPGKWFIHSLRNKITGHTIITVYKKIA